MKDFRGFDDLDCPEVEEAEDMLAKLCDIRLWIARRAAQDRTRAYQRAYKRQVRTERGAGNDNAAPESPSAA